MPMCFSDAVQMSKFSCFELNANDEKLATVFASLH